MNSMTKLMVEGSHFELVNGMDLPKTNVVQICSEKVYTNGNTNMAVFLCEVVDEESED